MKFFIPAFIIGAVLNIFVLSSETGLAFYGEFTSAIRDIENTAKSPFIYEDDAAGFVLKTPSVLYFVKNNGALKEQLPITGSEGISGNGQYRIRYAKTGSEIEFYGGGQRFWKQKSMEYPYLSHSGRLIFMLNGDQSAARVIDLNGNEIGIKTIAGRVCTVISFAEHEDFGGAGFLDGSFQAVKADGGGIAAGRVYGGGMVKSMAISDNGRFVVVHGGNTKQDHIEIHHTGTGKSYTRSIASVHISKTPIHAANDGRVVVLDKSALLFLDEKAKVDFAIPLDEKRDGHASIKEGAAAYALGYTTRRGLARFLLIAKNGNIICQRDFPGESFLDIAFEKELIFLRGSDNLYCYSLHEKAE